MLVRRIFDIGQEIKNSGISSKIDGSEYLTMLNTLAQILNTLGIRPNQMLDMKDVVEEIERLKKLDI